MSRDNSTESRGKQVLVGAAILFAVSGMVVGLLMGWRFIPGWVGESVGTVVGVMSTPFFMEASFALLGLLIVLGLNTWRRHRDGDELVFLAEISNPGDGKPEAGQPTGAGEASRDGAAD